MESLEKIHVLSYYLVKYYIAAEFIVIWIEKHMLGVNFRIIHNNDKRRF